MDENKDGPTTVICMDDNEQALLTLLKAYFLYGTINI